MLSISQAAPSKSIQGTEGLKRKDVLSYSLRSSYRGIHRGSDSCVDFSRICMLYAIVTRTTDTTDKSKKPKKHTKAWLHWCRARSWLHTPFVRMYKPLMKLLSWSLHLLRSSPRLQWRALPSESNGEIVVVSLRPSCSRKAVEPPETHAWQTEMLLWLVEWSSRGWIWAPCWFAGRNGATCLRIPRQPHAFADKWPDARVWGICKGLSPERLARVCLNGSISTVTKDCIGTCKFSLGRLFAQALEKHRVGVDSKCSHSQLPVTLAHHDPTVRLLEQVSSLASRLTSCKFMSMWWS